MESCVGIHRMLNRFVSDFSVLLGDGRRSVVQQYLQPAFWSMMRKYLPLSTGMSEVTDAPPFGVAQNRWKLQARSAGLSKVPFREVR